jgi:hypothetical protein
MWNVVDFPSLWQPFVDSCTHWHSYLSLLSPPTVYSYIPLLAHHSNKHCFLYPTSTVLICDLSPWQQEKWVSSSLSHYPDVFYWYPVLHWTNGQHWCGVCSNNYNSSSCGPILCSLVLHWTSGVLVHIFYYFSLFYCLMFSIGIPCCTGLMDNIGVVFVLIIIILQVVAPFSVLQCCTGPVECRCIYFIISVFSIAWCFLLVSRVALD